MHTRRLFLRQTALAQTALAQTALAMRTGSLYAQDGATFSSDVKVVNVLATVRTKAGEIVQDLTKEEFVLTESGRPQTIRYFSRDTNLPLVLGLLVDTSGSQRMVLEEEQEASFRFLETVLREDVDRTFVVHFDYRPEVLQNLTSSRAKLEQALERVTLPFQYRGAGGTTLYDSVYLCSNLITRKLTGRKALILLTDGEDTSSRTSLEQAIEAAQRADTLIYSILFSDQSFGGEVSAEAGSDRTARVSCKRCRAKRAVGFSRFRRSIRWSRSTNSFRRNCAASTAWAIPHRIPQISPSARLESQPSAKGSSYRRDPAITPTKDNGVGGHDAFCTRSAARGSRGFGIQAMGGTRRAFRNA